MGEGTKSVEEEIVRQFRQNNLGPADMLLPLASIGKREEFSKVIRSKKQEHPELAISGGGSIFDMLTFSEYFGGLDRFNLNRGRFEAFFVYNRATTRGDLRQRLQENSSNDNVLAVLNAIPTEGRPGNFWARLLSEPKISAFPGVKVASSKISFFQTVPLLSWGSSPQTNLTITFRRLKSEIRVWRLPGKSIRFIIQSRMVSGKLKLVRYGNCRLGWKSFTS